jgi:hypothetical protein
MFPYDIPYLHADGLSRLRCFNVLMLHLHRLDHLLKIGGMSFEVYGISNVEIAGLQLNNGHTGMIVIMGHFSNEKTGRRRGGDLLLYRGNRNEGFPDDRNKGPGGGRFFYRGGFLYRFFYRF